MRFHSFFFYFYDVNVFQQIIVYTFPKIFHFTEL